MHPYRGWPFLSDPTHPVLSAAWAVLVHGLIGVLVVAPIVLRSHRRALWGALAFAGGSVLDLDHAIAAGSLDPSRLEHIAGGRPATHSLLFILLLALFALALSRRILFAWSVFAVMAAHLLFDGAGGAERWLYPLQRPEGLPWLACPVGITALFLVSVLAVRSPRSLARIHAVETSRGLGPGLMSPLERADGGA
jgi:hypothetical protein